MSIPNYSLLAEETLGQSLQNDYNMAARPYQIAALGLNNQQLQQAIASEALRQKRLKQFYADHAAGMNYLKQMQLHPEYAQEIGSEHTAQRKQALDDYLSKGGNLQQAQMMFPDLFTPQKLIDAAHYRQSDATAAAAQQETGRENQFRDSLDTWKVMHPQNRSTKPPLTEDDKKIGGLLSRLQVSPSGVLTDLQNNRDEYKRLGDEYHLDLSPETLANNPSGFKQQLEDHWNTTHPDYKLVGTLIRATDPKFQQEMESKNRLRTAQSNLANVRANVAQTLLPYDVDKAKTDTKQGELDYQTKLTDNLGKVAQAVKDTQKTREGTEIYKQSLNNINWLMGHPKQLSHTMSQWHLLPYNTGPTDDVINRLNQIISSYYGRNLKDLFGNKPTNLDLVTNLGKMSGMTVGKYGAAGTPTYMRELLKRLRKGFQGRIEDNKQLGDLYKSQESQYRSASNPVGNTQMGDSQLPPNVKRSPKDGQLYIKTGPNTWVPYTGAVQ